MGDAKARDGIQVIARAVAVLRALKDSQTGLSLGQIADRTGLPRSTVQRIVAALVGERMLAPARKGVRLGPELQVLAEAARHNTVDLCRPYLVDLALQTGETVDLSMLRGGQMVFLDQVPGTHRLRAVSSVGEVFPLTTTANGRAALALLSDLEAAALAGPETSDWPGLHTCLQGVRQIGYAEDLDDHTLGISAIGAAFRDAEAQVYAISVPIPTSRFAGQRDAVIAAILALKADLVIG